MALDLHEVIIRPVMSEKSRRLGRQNQLVLEVHPQANKPMVVSALKALFNAEIVSIRSAVRKGKRRTVGRRVVEGTDVKRMYVTLKAGSMSAQAALGGAEVVAPVSSRPHRS